MNTKKLASLLAIAAVGVTGILSVAPANAMRRMDTKTAPTMRRMN